MRGFYRHARRAGVRLAVMRENYLQLSFLFRKQLPAALLLVLIASSANPTQAQQQSALQSAREAMEANQYSAAEQFYRKALAQAPSSAGVLTGLGLSLQMQGRAAGAMRYYSLALKQGYVPETYALLAEEKCAMGDVDGARPMLGKIFREERKNLRVLSAVLHAFWISTSRLNPRLSTRRYWTVKTTRRIWPSCSWANLICSADSFLPAS